VNNDAFYLIDLLNEIDYVKINIYIQAVKQNTGGKDGKPHNSYGSEGWGFDSSWARHINLLRSRLFIISEICNK
jgi:hypothetical protein